MAPTASLTDVSRGAFISWMRRSQTVAAVAVNADFLLTILYAHFKKPLAEPQDVIAFAYTTLVDVRIPGWPANENNLNNDSIQQKSQEG